MSLKKLLILPVGFLFTTFIYISCCKCTDVQTPFYLVRNASVNPLGSGGVLIDNGTPVTADTIFLNYYLSVNCIAEAKTDFSFLVNGAYACKCPECGGQGLKSKLLTIEITSDNVFNGIAAGNSLNSFFKIKADYVSMPDFNIDSLVNNFNTQGGIRTGFSVFTKTKPGNTFAHKLKMNMVFANSTVVTVFTKPITWQ